jgi:hypothetical protein
LFMYMIDLFFLNCETGRCFKPSLMDSHTIEVEIVIGIIFILFYSLLFSNGNAEGF